MNHQKVYENIVQKAKSENRQKGEGTYYEKHHILPRCLGGDNKMDNLVLLTAKEHFICHKLLTKLYPKERGINLALFAMVNFQNNSRVNHIKYTARDYAYSKELHNSIPVSEETRKKLSNTYKPISKENRLKGWETRRENNYEAWNKGKTNIYSKETIEKIRIARLGTAHKELSKEKIRKSMKGKHAGENNPMAGKSLMDVWTEKYGKKEAIERYNNWKQSISKARKKKK